MDISNRDAQHEKSEKQLKALKESYKGMFKTYSQELLNEDAFAVGKKLKGGKKIEIKEEDTPDEKNDEPKDDKPVVDGEPKVDAPVDADGDHDGDEVVPPVSTDTPEGGALDSQDQLSTREFVGAFLKGLPSDVDLANSVDANGVFKASVNDQQHGQFTILAFPASKTTHQVADLVEPALPGAAVGAVPPVVPGAAPVVPPVVPGAVPPVVPGTEPVVPPVVPGEAPVVPPTEVVPPVEEPVVQEVVVPPVVKPVVKCMDPRCPEHGMEAGAMMESEREKQRDPILEGRKNWTSMVRKLLTEGKTVELKEDVSKLEARVKAIETSLAAETDEDEKKALQIDLGKAKMALSRAKNPTKVVSHGEDDE